VNAREKAVDTDSYDMFGKEDKLFSSDFFRAR
jgi:hypothetical protein